MWGFVLLVIIVVALWKWFRYTGPDQPVTGAVFVTGCDSGMGENTAFHLANVGYHVFAACYLKESFAKYSGHPNVTALQVDVSNIESVKQAAEDVRRHIRELRLSGLFGVLQCAGIAYTAPFEYVPIETFRRQVDVNFFGYVYVAHIFLPLLKESVLKDGSSTPTRRARIAFVSSGPVPGPGVPFITSYLASKWAGEAVIQGLRMEMSLRQLPIDCVMVSPGVVKPTRLAEEGNALLEKTFREMPPQATTEYRGAVEVFRAFQIAEKGTHVSVVGRQMERIMRDGRPLLRYYVGWDAVASTVVGVLPTRLKELLLRNTLFRAYTHGPHMDIGKLRIYLP